MRRAWGTACATLAAVLGGGIEFRALEFRNLFCAVLLLSQLRISRRISISFVLRLAPAWVTRRVVLCLLFCPFTILRRVPCLPCSV